MEKSSIESTPKMTCLCAPTTHPGSFRCRLHRVASNASMLGPTSSKSALSCISNAGAGVSNLPAKVGKSTVNTLIKCSAIEKKSKGETSVPKPQLKSKKLPGRSRLNKVTFARDMREANKGILPHAEIPLCVMQPKFSTPNRRAQSVSSMRLLVLRNCQSLIKEDVWRYSLMRSLAHERPLPIMSQ